MAHLLPPYLEQQAFDYQSRPKVVSFELRVSMKVKNIGPMAHNRNVTALSNPNNVALSLSDVATLVPVRYPNDTPGIIRIR